MEDEEGKLLRANKWRQVVKNYWPWQTSWVMTHKFTEEDWTDILVLETNVKAVVSLIPQWMKAGWSPVRRMVSSDQSPSKPTRQPVNQSSRGKWPLRVGSRWDRTTVYRAYAPPDTRPKLTKQLEQNTNKNNTGSKLTNEDWSDQVHGGTDNILDRWCLRFKKMPTISQGSECSDTTEV